MKKIVLLLVCNFLTAIGFAQPYLEKPDTARSKQAISIGPNTLDFKIERGKSGKQIIRVVNNKPRLYKFTFFARDWDIDSMGKSIHFDSAGKEPFSCAKWVTFDNPYVEVDAGQTKEVIVTMNVPDSAEATAEMKWCAIVAQMGGEYLPPKQHGEATAVLKRNINVIMHAYQTPPSLNHKELRMTDFLYDEKERKFIVKSENVGNTSIRCMYTLELSSLDNGKKIEIDPVEKVLVLPGHKRIVEFKLPENVEKGKYVAVSTIDAQDDEVPLEAAQKEVQL